MNNHLFSIDMSVAADDGTVTGGYTQIHSVYMNADGPGFTTVAGEPPIDFYWWSGSPERTQTLTIDYTDFRDAITSTGYIEIIFALNTGGGAPTTMYFDNARIYGGLGTLRPYPDEVLADSPALYLRLEEDSVLNTGSGSGLLTDSSVNGYWALWRANTEFRANAGIGNCRYLPALPDDPATPDVTEGNQNAIAAGNTGTFDWTFEFSDEFAFAPDDITFEFWYNSTAQTPTDANGLEPYAVFFQQVKDSFYQAPGMSNSGGTLRILSGDPNAAEIAAGTQRWWYTNVPTPLDGQWHHVVVVYDESYGGDANRMGIQLYVDGDRAASTVVGDETRPARLGPEFDHLVIGGANDLGWSYNNYRGLIDEFAIYPGILPADRVAAHFNAGMCAMSRGDLTGDCRVDMEDFAVIARDWLLCNDPDLFGVDLDCVPNW